MPDKKSFFQKLAAIVSPSATAAEPISGSFIQRDGVAVDICDESVSLEEILSFFEERIPWLEIALSPQLPDDANSPSTKEQIFNHFAEILEAQHYEWTTAFRGSSSKAL